MQQPAATAPAATAAHQAEQAGSNLPRVLLENYLMLSASLENQNLGRLQDMLL